MIRFTQKVKVKVIRDCKPDSIHIIIPDPVLTYVPLFSFPPLPSFWGVFHSEGFFTPQNIKNPTECSQIKNPPMGGKKPSKKKVWTIGQFSVIFKNQ